MKVLITGGAGFIGSHAAEYFAEKGNDIVVLDNLSRGSLLGKNLSGQSYNWEYLRKFKNIKLIKGDVRNIQDITEASAEAQVIIHTAAQVAVTTSLTDPRTDFETNTSGTFNVLECARKNDSAVVFCSTNKVYGENVNKVSVNAEQKRYRFSDEQYRNGIPETFSIDLCGHSPYGCSKLAADIYMQDYADTYDLKTGVFRMSCIYGDRQFGVEDQGWVAWFIIALLTNKPLMIYGDGKQVRDVLYVDDLIKAYDKFLNSGIKHEVFNMGGGAENTISLIELLEILYEKTQKKPQISYSNWRQADQKVYISDISKAKATLNWKPEINPREGISQIVEWVSKNNNMFARA